MAWTQQQKKAIDLDNKNILVSAAAGSGKTAVLVERVVSHLLRPEGTEGAWSVDRLLVVTFTKAAAAEMSERIDARLKAAVAEELDREEPDRAVISRLEKQRVLLSLADISTIHAFCQKLIKNNFSALDLDPRFRVANENELALLQQDVLEEVFENRYGLDDEVLESLGEKYASDRGDGALYEIVLKLHEMSRNQPFPEVWLKSLAEDYLPKDAGENTRLKDYGKWWKLIYNNISQGMDKAEAYIEEFRQLYREESNPKVIGKYEEMLERYDFIDSRIRLAMDKDWQDIYDAFDLTRQEETMFLRMHSLRKDVDADLKKVLGKINDNIKEAVCKVRDAYVVDREATMVEDLHELTQEAQNLVDLVMEYGRAFAAAKKERNIIDYGDMEHLALELLMSEKSTPEHIEPSDTALGLREKYQEIMVDEYQDTNQVQNTIVSLLAGEDRGNLFVVGDVKQSIYGFRASEPQLFMDKYESYAKEQEARELITLGRNFRSRREILSGVNFVFGQLMDKASMDIDYDERAMLNPGEPYGYQEPENGRTLPPEMAVELDIIMEQGIEAEGDSEEDAAEDAAAGNDEAVMELKNIQMEAQYIADRLKALKNSGYLVFDKNCKTNNGYRPMLWRDVVILLRANGGKAEKMQEILQANDIPVFAGIDGGYFQTTEIQVMTSLLSVIDNSHQDIPLAAVLYSPVVGLSAEQLAKVRLTAREGNLYQALVVAGSAESPLSSRIKNKLADFLAKLSSWRQLSNRTGVAELLWQLYQDTGYYDYVGCMPGGLLRQANLRMLMTRAQEFEATDYRGLFRFLGFVEKLKNMETDLSVARTLGENEDVVRIMTIHKSKGLEFPIVVLSDMAKKFNTMDLGGTVLFHKSAGLGLDNIDTAKSVSYPSFSSMALKAAMRHDLVAEELRVLYVAMTRAREKLIMVGHVGNGKKAAEKWCRYREYSLEPEAWNEELPRQILPAYAINGAGNYLEWVAMAAARHSDGKVFAWLLDLTEEQYVQALGHMHSTMGSESRWSINLVSAGSISLPMAAAGEKKEVLEAVIRGEELPRSPEWDEKINHVLSWHYDFQGTENVPAKLSVSELKRRFARELQDEPEYDLLGKGTGQYDMEYAYQRPLFLQRQEEGRGGRRRGAEYGTLMHSIMQHLDLKAPLDEDGIRRQLSSMVEQEIITADQMEMADIRFVTGFFESELGQRMLQAQKIWREMPFCRMLQAKEYYCEVEDDRAEIFNQGVIDVLFRDAGGKLVLIDYKTDRNISPRLLKKRYAMQLELYAQAVAAVLGQQVAEKYLYMLRDGTIIEI